MFATLAGDPKFTKLDLSQANAQFESDSDSEDLLTINTHPGLYRYRRLAYGISSTRVIFQSGIDQVLVGCPQVVCRIDDILITGPDDESNLKSLRQVFQRKKVVFLTNHMGHMVTAGGLHATTDKIEDVTNTPSPTTVTDLIAYLGLIN